LASLRSSGRLLRRDGDLGVRVLFHLLQVASLLPDQASDEVVVSQNLQRNLVGPAEEEPAVSFVSLAVRLHSEGN